MADGTLVKDGLHITADFINRESACILELRYEALTCNSIGETGTGKSAHIYIDQQYNFKSVILLGDVQHPSFPR